MNKKKCSIKWGLFAPRKAGELPIPRKEILTTTMILYIDAFPSRVFNVEETKQSNDPKGEWF